MSDLLWWVLIAVLFISTLAFAWWGLSRPDNNPDYPQEYGPWSGR